MTAFFFLLAVGLAVAAVQFKNPLRRRLFIGAIAGAAIGVGMFIFTPDDAQTNAAAVASPTAAPLMGAAEQTDPPESAPSPTPRPPSYKQRLAIEKRAFLASVDESISGGQIAGNPYKYVGARVDFHCTVADIPAPDFFNASCGTEADGYTPAVIVIEYAGTSNLDQGQAVRVIGTVKSPIEGTNQMGGSMSFPTVRARFME